jgi:hypothetical protein
MDNQQNNYPFIDAQNLYLAIQELALVSDLRNKLEYILIIL